MPLSLAKPRKAAWKLIFVFEHERENVEDEHTREVSEFSCENRQQSSVDEVQSERNHKQNLFAPFAGSGDKKKNISLSMLTFLRLRFVFRFGNLPHILTSHVRAEGEFRKRRRLESASFLSRDHKWKILHDSFLSAALLAQYGIFWVWRWKFGWLQMKSLRKAFLDAGIRIDRGFLRVFVFLML